MAFSLNEERDTSLIATKFRFCLCLPLYTVAWAPFPITSSNTYAIRPSKREDPISYTAVARWWDRRAHWIQRKRWAEKERAFEYVGCRGIGEKQGRHVPFASAFCDCGNGRKKRGLVLCQLISMLLLLMQRSNDYQIKGGMRNAKGHDDHNCLQNGIQLHSITR